MRILWRVLAVVALFLAAGYTTMHVLVARGVARGVPEYDVRLGAAMGGLFVGGAAATLLLLALFLGGKRSGGARDE